MAFNSAHHNPQPSRLPVVLLASMLLNPARAPWSTTRQVVQNCEYNLERSQCPFCAAARHKGVSLVAFDSSGACLLNNGGCCADRRLGFGQRREDLQSYRFEYFQKNSLANYYESGPVRFFHPGHDMIYWHSSAGADRAGKCVWSDDFQASDATPRP